MEKRTFSTLGLGLGLMAIATVASQLVLANFIKYYYPDIAAQSWFSYILIACFYFIGIPIFYVFTKNVPRYSHDSTEKYGIGSIAVLYFICMAATYVFSLVGNIFNLLLSYIMGGSGMNAVAEIISDVNPFIVLLFVGILSPILEELVFRKWLLQPLCAFGDKTAILFTSAMFALFHMNFSQFFYAFVVGMVLAYTAVKTGSIKTSVILHIAINITGSVLIPKLSLSANPQLVYISIGIIITFVVLGALFLALNVKKIRLNEAPFAFSVPINFALQYLNAGTLVYVVFCIAMFFLNATV